MRDSKGITRLRFLLIAGLLSLWAEPFGQAQSVNRRAIVLACDLPIYPPTAIAARLEGIVLVKITVSKGVVVKAEVASPVHLILASAAKRNTLSWRFAPEITETIEIRYIFELSKTEVLQPENPDIQMQLPDLVKIVAKPVKALSIGKSL